MTFDTLHPKDPFYSFPKKDDSALQFQSVKILSLFSHFLRFIFGGSKLTLGCCIGLNLFGWIFGLFLGFGIFGSRCFGLLGLFSRQRFLLRVVGLTFFINLNKLRKLKINKNF